MDAEKIATLFGLPGLIIAVWYLLETQKNKRLEKESESKAKAREREADLEEKKIAAMTTAFQSLNTKIEEHQRDEFEHHAQTREAIVGLHTSFANQFDLTPPPQLAAPVPEPLPARKQGRADTPGRGTYFMRPGTKDDR
jgi:hypothetical protein